MARKEPAEHPERQGRGARAPDTQTPLVRFGGGPGARARSGLRTERPRRRRPRTACQTSNRRADAAAAGRAAATGQKPARGDTRPPPRRGRPRRATSAGFPPRASPTPDGETGSRELDRPRAGGGHRRISEPATRTARGPPESASHQAGAARPSRDHRHRFSPGPPSRGRLAGTKAGGARSRGATRPLSRPPSADGDRERDVPRPRAPASPGEARGKGDVDSDGRGPSRGGRRRQRASSGGPVTANGAAAARTGAPPWTAVRRPEDAEPLGREGEDEKGSGERRAAPAPPEGGGGGAPRGPPGETPAAEGGASPPRRERESARARRRFTPPPGPPVSRQASRPAADRAAARTSAEAGPRRGGGRGTTLPGTAPRVREDDGAGDGLPGASRERLPPPRKHPPPRAAARSPGGSHRAARVFKPPPGFAAFDPPGLATEGGPQKRGR